MAAVRFAPIVFLLSACQADPPANEAPGNATAVEAPASAPSNESAAAPAGIDYDHFQVVLHDAGMLVATPGRGVPLKFDESGQAEVEEAMSDFGTPERRSGPDDCPAGPLNFLEYPSGLSLAFLEGKFVGYWADRETKGAVTASGVHPGSPRAAIGSAKITEASFGKLAEVDGAVALLTEDEKFVDALYAGLACIYD